MSISKKVDISGLMVEFKGKDSLVDGLISTFDAESISSTPDISVEFLDVLPELDGEVVFSAKKNLYFNESAIVINLYDGLSVQLVTSAPTWKVFVARKDMPMHKKLYSFALGKEKRLLNTFLSYNCFWFILQLKLLNHGRSFSHAASFSNGEGASMITGTGGCGKTSSLFYLLDNDNFSYLSEDFSVVSLEGFSFYSCKPLSIYKSDLGFGSKTLSGVKDMLSIVERIIWYFSGYLRINPQKKVLPHSLLEKRVSNKQRIKQVFYAIRTKSLSTIEPISVSEMSERMAYASLREFKLLNEIQHAIACNAIGDSPIISYSEHLTSMKKIYESALSDSETYLLKIPQKAKPQQLIELIYEHTSLK